MKFIEYFLKREKYYDRIIHHHMRLLLRVRLELAVLTRDDQPWFTKRVLIIHAAKY